MAPGGTEDENIDFQQSCHTAWRSAMWARKSQPNPLSGGKGRQALGWVATSTRPPTPSGSATAVAAPASPPRRGFS